MPDRRETLKIIGAIGTTCAFPFAANELYGQHVHAPAAPPPAYGEPKFFAVAEFHTLGTMVDLIIPPTDTPGAVAAGVPSYIDLVVSSNAEWQQLFRQGLMWLQTNHFDALTEAQRFELLRPWVDRDGPELQARFLRTAKSMTADGYYTSRVGLIEELGYSGNTALESFPGCQVHEH